ncbi:MAG: lactate utilization protein [Clostridia bacterium]|nr:lactate utilization protein [Clostridia bacterium]
MTELMKNAAAALADRGFEVYTVATAPVAAEKILSLIPEGASVGVGGSVTIDELSVVPKLLSSGHAVHWHWLTDEDRHAVARRAAAADVYLASSNAVTADGQMVNIDATCNRVAAMIQGPQTVILAIGVNKLVDGGISAAIGRIKTQACPPNARRLGLKTPCALTGKCNERECNGKGMCSATTIMHHPPKAKRVVIVLIGQSIGY